MLQILSKKSLARGKNKRVTTDYTDYTEKNYARKRYQAKKIFKFSVFTTQQYLARK
jgi:hypothetical protein